MKYDFDQVIDRHGTDSSKWDCGAKLLKRGYTTRYDKETIPLFNADMMYNQRNKRGSQTDNRKSECS